MVKTTTFKAFNEATSQARLIKHLTIIKNLMSEAITNKRIFDIYSNEYKYENNSNVKFINGLEAKTSLIRSQKLIYELHEFAKEEFEYYGVDPSLIFPPLQKGKPEIKLTGKFKQKDQDVSIVPKTIIDEEGPITWGLVGASGNRISPYGSYKEERILALNVRSQMSSVDKNIDTLFERMLAEPLNLHLQYPRLVIGELYMIPVFEYKDSSMKDNIVEFKKKHVNIEKFITFFNELNDYQTTGDIIEPYKYNKAGLVVADFSRDIPKLYTNTAELKKDGLVSMDFPLELQKLSPVKLVYDLLREYKLQFENEELI